MMEDSFDDYNNRISSMRTDVEIRRRSGLVELPSDRFIPDNAGDWKPKTYPGYTVITPTFEDESENVRTYAKLGDIQHFLLKRLGADKTAPAPLSAFHLTVADLVAGNTYLTKVQGSRQLDLLQTLSSVFNQMNIQGQVKLQVLGLSLFVKGFIIAIVKALDESGYKSLITLRNAIYDDSTLKNFGVERNFKFTGHITLAYIENALQDTNSISETLIAGNERFFAKPLPLQAVRAEVRRFDDMSAFNRGSGWPLFEFT